MEFLGHQQTPTTGEHRQGLAVLDELSHVTALVDLHSSVSP
jgi:hypothetical protein